VLVPRRDYVLKDRGWFFVTEWDARLDVALEPLPVEPGLSATCNSSGACTIVLPASPRDFCVPRLLRVAPAGILVSDVKHVQAPVGNGAVLVSFDVDPATRGATQFLVHLCHSNVDAAGAGAVQSHWAITSDPIRVPASRL
jgi:hypothetical protein